MIAKNAWEDCRENGVRRHATKRKRNRKTKKKEEKERKDTQRKERKTKKGEKKGVETSNEKWREAMHTHVYK